jgi:hypothetical protein
VKINRDFDIKSAEQTTYTWDGMTFLEDLDKILAEENIGPKLDYIGQPSTHYLQGNFIFAQINLSQKD